MRHFILTAFIIWAFAASAQFNTIGMRRPCQQSSPTINVNRQDTINDYIDDSITVSDSVPEMKDNLSVSWCSLPLKGKFQISSKFGLRRNPFGKNATERHCGLDLSAKSGTTVYAMLPGEIVGIGFDSRSGNYIKLSHGSLTVTYCHLMRKPSIAIGTKILPGQPVAHVGSTGRSTGPHLHITLKKNGRVLDPAILLDYISQFI